MHVWSESAPSERQSSAALRTTASAVRQQLQRSAPGNEVICLTFYPIEFLLTFSVNIALKWVRCLTDVRTDHSAAPQTACYRMPQSWCFAFLLAFFVVSGLDLSAASTGPVSSFVTKSGSQLVVDGKPFYHIGFNAVWMPSSAAYGLTQRVDATLDAAQRTDMKVVRVWGFNDAFPYLPGKYTEKQGWGLDYVIAAAGRRGIRVELALANFWPAYLGPEVWLQFAEGRPGDPTSTAGKTIADFYRSPRALQLLEQHIRVLTSRVNSLTQVAYKDDPTIIGYNLFNEPRCPGCTVEDMAARNAFISALSETLRTAAPKQLIFSGTEGFFAAGDSNVGHNPGAGGQCEGEDWTSEIKLFDVATTHMYWRQMEALQQTEGRRPGFEFYIQYLHQKLKLFSRLAKESGRPLVLEEFGLTKRFFNAAEVKIVVAVVADALIAAKKEGTPLMSAWLWQAAPFGDPDVGGYDIALTKPLTNKTVGLGNPPKLSSGSRMDNILKPYVDRTGGVNEAARTAVAAPVGIAERAVVGRKMQATTGQVLVKVGEDDLGPFRRGAQRAACAAAVAKWPEQKVAAEIDVQAYVNMVAQHDIVDILAEASRLLSQ